jgi:hypothetical protein
MGFLNCSQMTKEDLLDSKSKENGEKEAHICQNHKTGIALRKIDAGRVEVRPLLERGKNNSRGERCAYRTIRSKTHFSALSYGLWPPAGLGAAVHSTTRSNASYDNVAIGERSLSGLSPGIAQSRRK